MAKKWIRCDALLRDNEDITSTQCLSAILSGKIDVYTEAGRKLLNTNVLAVKGPSTKPEIQKDAAECATSLACNVRIQVGSEPDNVFKPNDSAKKESINARIECMRGLYYYIYPETAVLDNFIRFRRLLDCPKDLVVEELSRYMLKTDDAIRCFELLPADDVPAPVAVAVAEVQEAPVAASEDTKQTKPSNKDMNKQDALTVAAEYWKKNPELRPAQVAGAILETRQVEWRGSTPASKTLRDWLAPHAPKSAKKIGRPSGIPK